MYYFIVLLLVFIHSQHIIELSYLYFYPNGISMFSTKIFSIVLHMYKVSQFMFFIKNFLGQCRSHFHFQRNNSLQNDIDHDIGGVFQRKKLLFNDNLGHH